SSARCCAANCASPSSTPARRRRERPEEYNPKPTDCSPWAFFSVWTGTPMLDIAIVEGVRTPFVKAFGPLAGVPAQELGRLATQAVLQRAGLRPDQVDQVVFGNVALPPDAANIARVIALQSGIPQDRIAHTVQRNCASGMEAITTAAQ